MSKREKTCQHCFWVPNRKSKKKTLKHKPAWNFRSLGHLKSLGTSWSFIHTALVSRILTSGKTRETKAVWMKDERLDPKTCLRFHAGLLKKEQKESMFKYCFLFFSFKRIRRIPRQNHGSIKIYPKWRLGAGRYRKTGTSFKYSERATEFCKISTLFLTGTTYILCKYIGQK